MKILITGAGGMIAQEFLRSITKGKAANTFANAELVLIDVVKAAAPEGISSRCRSIVEDFGNIKFLSDIMGWQPDLILHFASVVSGEAERNFEKGYRVNFHSTYRLLDEIRMASQANSYYPKFIFASSIAVYGAPFSFPIADDFHLTPRTTYGTQKAMIELMVNDLSRRGVLDGVSIRLPTICVRPGAPNAAASGFFSNIIREPLAGKRAILPVSDHHRHWFASPRSAAGFFIHAADLDLERLGRDRALAMPGVSATVAEQIEALRRVAGQSAVDLIEFQRDDQIEEMVKHWAPGFSATRARNLGFTAEMSFDEIVMDHIQNCT